MMRMRGMKLKKRVLFVFICICVFLSIVVVFDLTGPSNSSDKNQKHYDKGLGYLQGQFEDMMGWRKVVTAPDLSLKFAQDVELRLKVERESGEAYRKQAEVNTQKIEMKDQSVDRLIQTLESRMQFSRSSFLQETFESIVRKLGPKRKTNDERLKWYKTRKPANTASNHKKFLYGIRRYSLYDPDNPAIEGLLKDMSTLPFDKLNMMESGTELKLFITFTDDSHAVFKPMRWPRDHETLPNHFYFNDYERHHAEIAAFHLDRLMGFYRVPPVVGRKVNMTREIFMLAEKALKKTFYVSPVGNLCFYGDCTYYCDSRHAFCGDVDMIEGSLMTFLPPKHYADRSRWRSPYRRSYSKFTKADWEIKNDFCDRLKASHYKYGQILTDIVETHIFDFITGNMDRHHVEVFSDFGNNSHVIQLDNGRGFGKTKVDEFSILAPLIQCCIIRKSTLHKLLKLYIGPERLSTLLNDSLKSDPLYPVLTDGHLNAVDRRVIHILRAVSLCVDRINDIKKIVIDDNL